jgi:hypothetical protein
MLRTTSVLPLATATIVAASLIAACGSSSPGASSSSGRPTEAQLRQAQQDANRFVSCMHAHGVSIPNPAVSGQAFKDALSNPTPGVQRADASCKHLLPGGGSQSHTTAYNPRRAAALLRFARCVRSHGFPNFPDPDGSGEITREMLAADGISLQQQGLIDAADACTSVTDGLLTRAAVARFAAGQ